jgi:hypothetical protein
VSQMSELESLYQEMADLTLPKCQSCRVPLSCCSPEYCDMAAEIMEKVGVTVEKQNHSTLMFMGPHGCVVPPHLRPLCTLHVCVINNIGVDVMDLDWTNTYFDLRDRITQAEWGAQRL